MLSNVISLIVILNVLFIKSNENVNLNETTPLTINLEIIYETTTPHKYETDFNGKDEQIDTLKTSIKEPSKLTTIDTSRFCSTFATCEECVQSSPWVGCKWCHDYGCTDKAEELCPEIEEITRMLPQDLKCPRIEPKDSTLVPAHVNMNFQMKLYTPDPTIYKRELICQLKLENRFIHLRAYLFHGTIFCSRITLDFEWSEAQANGVLSVIWGGANPFSNNLIITVYKCEVMATDCDSCGNIPEEYGCGWCQSTNSCVIGDNCGKDFIKFRQNRTSCSGIEK